MPDIMNQAMSAVVKQRPEVGRVLREYGIACAGCSVGSCALKDILLYHDVPEERKAEMWARIGEAAGQGPLAPPEGAAPPSRAPRGASPPVKKLVAEHTLIKRLLALIPHILADLDLDTEPGRARVLGAVDFIRNYADKFHHAKEEDILFKYFDETQDIIQVMCEDHTAARAHVKAVEQGVHERDYAAVAQRLEAYRELLSGHIAKEDDVLYPWMDRQLGDRRIGELHSRFQRVDAGEFPAGHAQKYEQFIERLEHEFGCGKGETL